VGFAVVHLHYSELSVSEDQKWYEAHQLHTLGCCRGDADVEESLLSSAKFAQFEGADPAKSSMTKVVRLRVAKIDSSQSAPPSSQPHLHVHLRLASLRHSRPQAGDIEVLRRRTNAHCAAVAL
jgi:hypothetical protein